MCFLPLKMPIKVALFEDNTKFLDAISIFVGSAPELQLAGAYSDTANLLDKMEQADPDVVLMDIGIMPLDGIEATRLCGRFRICAEDGSPECAVAVYPRCF